MIPDNVRKCVAFLGYRPRTRPDDLRWGGTAFFVEVPLKDERRAVRYIVTAKHCIEDILDRSIDRVVYVRLNNMLHGAVTIPTDALKWRFHSTDSTIDVAASPFAMDNENYDHLHIQFRAFCLPNEIQRHQIGIGDNVFIVGLFLQHPGRQRALPIARVGAIAAMPEEKVRTSRYGDLDAFLIECRSIGGLSGSPVFVTLDPTVDIPVGKAAVIEKVHDGRITPAFRLLGLIHGHWDSAAMLDAGMMDDDSGGDERSNRKFHAGIAIVVPAEKIAAVLYQPEFTAARDQLS